MKSSASVDFDRARSIGREWGESNGVLTKSRFAALECDPATFAAAEARQIATLHLEDVSAIPFVSVIPGVERYQHRARVRAFDGDVFAAVTPISEGYEDYCREVLDLGQPGLVMAEPVAEATAVARACRRGSAWKELVRWTRDNGNVLLHPYMAIEDVWELGAALAAETKRDVRVLGPSPQSLWVANDKSALTQVVDAVVGAGWNMRTVRARSVETVVDAMADFARSMDWVGLKRTRCASAMGNAVFEARWILETPRRELVAAVKTFLDRTEWDGREEVLVVEWAQTDCSPSTQMWIPPLGAGDPRLEGIYEQLLEGAEKVFLGSRPSTLSAAIHDDLARASLLVAAAFQQLGYVGRCSFDFIVVGDPEGEFDVRFTECNGRWGGTSTPMFLVDRLGWGDARGRRPYHAQDFVHPDLVGATFLELRKALSHLLYDPRTGQGRFVLYNVGPLEADGKFDIISLGDTPADAVEGIEKVLPDALGIG